MAVSQIEEKILGRLAKETESSSPVLSAALYQVLGLSILLSRKLFRARKVRKLDTTRDTKSLQLYHHIIWLAREGLSITEVHILPRCQHGEYGPECQVMAAKLRASLYHVFCLFHNHPSVSVISSRSSGSPSPPSSGEKASNGWKSPSRTSRHNGERKNGGSHLRDPIPSMTSETSYVTNPYALPTQTPPPRGPPPPVPVDQTRRTPTRPPGLDMPSPRTFLLPPLNFVPMAHDHFQTAQALADSVLPAAHGLRLSVSLEHSAFIWDCEKEHERARKLARKTIKNVYSSSEGLDDDEFADASALVQALAGIIKRGEDMKRRSVESLRRASSERLSNVKAGKQVDRTIAVSPASSRSRRSPATPGRSAQQAYIRRTPDRLSTVPEVDSTASEGQPTQQPFSPSASRLSSRGSHHRQLQNGTPSSVSSDKAAKRRAVEKAEEEHHRRSSQSSKRSGSKESERSRRDPVQRKPVPPRTSSKPESRSGSDKDRDKTNASRKSHKNSSSGKRGREEQGDPAGKSSRRRRSSRGSAGSRGSKSSRRSKSGNSNSGSGKHSRQGTPDGPPASSPPPPPPRQREQAPKAQVGVGPTASKTAAAQDRREAVLRALEVISAAAAINTQPQVKHGQGNQLFRGIWRLV